MSTLDRTQERASEDGGRTLIPSASLREQARDAIRSRIITGELVPRQVYSARALADELGVSATPVREAMLDLTRDHLLLPVRNKGFEVAALSDQDLGHILDLRMLLEPPSSRRLAGLLSENQVAYLSRLTEETEDAASQGDLVRFLVGDREFHIGLLSQLENERLLEIVRSLRDQQRLYGLAGLRATGHLAESASEHRELLAAIAAGDGDSAEALTVRHLRHTRGVWAGRDQNDGQKREPTSVSELTHVPVGTD
jgi:DNA-binding GntR family transcriptional regulator